jgi:hypothetical protein
MTKIIQEQPEDSSYDEILRELAFVRMIERGLEDSHAHYTISNQEMKRRIRTWQTYTGLPKRSAGYVISTTILQQRTQTQPKSENGKGTKTTARAAGVTMPHPLQVGSNPLPGQLHSAKPFLEPGWLTPPLRP